LILLEEKLPDMPLTQLLQQIRNDSTTRLLPVMVASREPQVRREAANLADGHR
jgi:CheY-like chemotaxis protein